LRHQLLNNNNNNNIDTGHNINKWSIFKPRLITSYASVVTQHMTDRKYQYQATDSRDLDRSRQGGTRLKEDSNDTESYGVSDNLIHKDNVRHIPRDKS